MIFVSRPGWLPSGCSLPPVNTTFTNNIIWAKIAVGFPEEPMLVTYSVLREPFWPPWVQTVIYGEGVLKGIDPGLVDMEGGDTHLDKFSPCVNRGTNEVLSYLDLDPEGDPRCVMGTVDIGADEYAGVHALGADVFTISEANGGAVQFALDGGVKNAKRFYMIFGSASGNAPGTLVVDDLYLPVNWDAFTNIVASVNYPRSLAFQGFYGFLDGEGRAQAVFDTCGPVPGMQGWKVSFAYALQGLPWDTVSNPVNITVGP